MGCSTQENTLLTRTYHQITSRYNIFYNAEQSFNEGVRKIENRFAYDYARILPVFTYTDPELASLANADFDRAIGKAGKIISNKSITARPTERGGIFEKDPEFYNKREYNRWVIESYLLTGKAHFYKHDFEAAINTFRYMTVEYGNEPLYYDAKVWLARSFSEKGRFNEARLLFNDMEEDDAFPDRLTAELHKTLADFYLKQGESKNAAHFLEKLLKSSTSRREHRRYTYILAQVNEITGNLDEAARYYREVARMNPDYEMALNAQMGLAGAYPAGSMENRELLEDLEKMLDDPRNNDYIDQIYYSIGIIYDLEGDRDKALEMYTLSAIIPGISSSGKARSYRTLADIYLNKKEYIIAQAYYDSTVQYMEGYNPEYADIMNKRNILTDLVEHINTYRLEDSLQLLAAMPENERKLEIDRIVALSRQERQESQLAVQEAEGAGSRLSRRDLQSLRLQAERRGEGQWYFYNQSAVDFGKAEFRSIWGSRRLEDNWRRESDEVITDKREDPEYASGEGVAPEPEETAPEGMRQFYLQNIPLTEEAMQRSHQEIKKALTGMSSIYADYLGDAQNAALTIEELVGRYPENENIPSLYYKLYQIFNAEGNTSRAKHYASLLSAEYPDSRYARIVEDPAYLKEIAKIEEEAELFYEETRQLFYQDEYEKVIERAADAVSRFPGSNLIPSFEYLEILSASATFGNIPDLKKTLAEFIDKYPGTEMAVNAANLISFMDKDYPDIAVEAGLIVTAAEFNSGEQGEHYFVLLIDNNEELVNRMVFNIINFNVDYFPRLNLQVSREDFSSKIQIVVVRGLSDRDVAMQYIRQFESDEDVFREVRLIEDPLFFIISPSNYSIFTDEKNISNYMLFFREEYDG